MQTVKPVHLAEIVCPSCGHKWRPRVEAPFKCTKCGRQIPYKEKPGRNGPDFAV